MSILGWSQAELARQIGYSEQQVTRWMAGSTVPKLVLVHLDLLVKVKCLSIEFGSIKEPAK